MEDFISKIKDLISKIKNYLYDDKSKKDVQDFFNNKQERKHELTDILGCYRHICLECGEELFEDKHFCDECWANFELLSGDMCPKCGRKVIGNTACNICKITNHSFDRAFSAFDYDSIIRKYIINMKFNNMTYLYRPLATYLAHIYLKNDIDVDYVTYVPMTKKATKDRGYNQSMLLAEEFSFLTGIEIFYGVEKIKETLYQKRLNAEDRRENMKNVFAVTGDVKGRNILVIDDVMTTCATVDSLAKVLKRKNAKKEFVLTLTSTGEKFTKEEN